MHKNHVPQKRLFKVDVYMLWLAFYWLKRYNPYYQEVEWSVEAATAWEAEDVVIGVVREADHDDGQAPPVTQQCFQSWMEHARSERLAGDLGYPIGQRVVEFLTKEFEEDSSADLCNFMRRVADVFDQSVFRMATTLPNEILSVALSARGVLEFGIPNNLDARASLEALRSLPALELPIDLQSFHREIDAIMMEFNGEESDVASAGTVAGGATGDDVAPRAEMVDSLASVASEVLGAERVLPGSASCDPESAEGPPEQRDRL